MDDKLRILATVLAGTGSGAVLGGVFGGVAGSLYWQSGRAAGTALGTSVARAFARAAGSELSPGTKGALIGATDGIVFLGLFGTLASAILAYSGQAEWEQVRPMAVAVLFLMAGAMLFGLVAYSLLQGGIGSVVWVFVGGLSGGGWGGRHYGPDGLFLGAVVGALAGTLGAALWRRLGAK
jgi:hypothetical protein